MSTRIPLFPLRTVLFPHGILPLRIFETRYTDMIRRCLREQGVFGVVLIQQGGEVGEVSVIAPVGCSARIIDFGTLPDGLLSIVARGERRFRVLSRGRQPDGLHVGEVEWLEDAPAALAPGEFAPLRELLARALEDLGEAYPAGEPRFDDAQWVGGHLGQVLPVAAAFRQQLLETDDALARLRLIDAMRREPEQPAGH